MSLARLLLRPDLQPADRLLVFTAVAIWRGDWTSVQDGIAAARQGSVPRTDCEELLLQTVLFCGFPRVVTAFEHLNASWPVPQPPTGGGLPVTAQAAAGAELFAGIYGRNTEAVHTMLRGCHGEFHDFVLEAAYGRILARPGLAPRRRELIAVGVLAAQDQVRQFAGHARGALHFGATTAELREVLVTALGDGPQLEPWLRHLRAPTS